MWLQILGLEHVGYSGFSTSENSVVAIFNINAFGKGFGST
jgi:hypothetical protein